MKFYFFKKKYHNFVRWKFNRFVHFNWPIFVFVVIWQQIMASNQSISVTSTAAAAELIDYLNSPHQQFMLCSKDWTKLGKEIKERRKNRNRTRKKRQHKNKGKNIGLNFVLWNCLRTDRKKQKEMKGKIDRNGGC